MAAVGLRIRRVWLRADGSLWGPPRLAGSDRERSARLHGAARFQHWHPERNVLRPSVEIRRCDAGLAKRWRMSPHRASSEPVPTSLPMVVSPLRRVLERHGVEVVLVSIEVWSDEVVVRARGLPSERTAALEDEFSDALERWNRQGADKDAVPRQPADRIFDVAVSVADDAGTVYSPTTSARGGTGTMLRAEWSFVPGPPETAQSLVVRIDESATSIELDASR